MDVSGDNEIARELDIGDTPNRGTQVLGGVVSTDVGKRVWRFNRVISGLGMSEAVRDGDWKPFYEMMPGESKVTAAYDHE